MSVEMILGFIKAIVPSKKIAAWILGVIGAGLALFMGISNSDLKASFCAADAVVLPAPAAVVAPAVEKPSAK